MPVRYTSPEEDSARWLRFRHRPGDIVISTRSKHGTTWMQMICAVLVLGRPDLPAPLASLSPWLDWLALPEAELFARLAAQPHRRFVKTHTPLDGLPLDDRASYIVVARDPLDAAVSLYHQGDNLDRDRLVELTGDADAGPRAERPDVRRWLATWAARDADPRTDLDSLPGVLHHLSDAWRRRDAENVILVHYDDLSADLDAEMRRLAGRLGLEPPAHRWPELVAAAGFAAMRAHAEQVAPDPAGVLRSKRAFFRAGRSGTGRQLLSSDSLNAYRDRTRAVLDPALDAWLHRGYEPAGKSTNNDRPDDE